MLTLSLRDNVREVQQVLEELNAGHREQTYPRRLERLFRTVEHDARAAGLQKFADMVQSAKEASKNVLEPEQTQPLVELLGEACAELTHVADALDAGRRHRLDSDLTDRLTAAAS